MTPDRIESALWHDLAQERAAFAPPPGDLSARVVIIGGGIMGLSAALELAQRGVDAIVLEADAIGVGASGRNGGLVVPALPRLGPGDALRLLGEERGAALNRIVMAAPDEVFGLIRTHGIACDPVQNGWLSPAHAPMLAPMLDKRAAEWRSHGGEVAYLDAAEARRRIGSERYHGALFARRGGHLNPFAYTNGLARAAAAAGARIFTGVPVRRVGRSGDLWQVETAHGAVRAQTVLQCTNAHLPGLPESGVPRAVVPLIVYQLATQAAPDAVRRTLLPGDEALSDTRNNLFACCYASNGALVTGGMAILQPGAPDRLKTILARRFGRIFPQLAPVRFTHIWRGRAALTGDFLPRVFQIDREWLAPIGCNGRGIAMSTALGMRLARYVATGDPAHVPLPVAGPQAIPLHGLRQFWPEAMLPLGIVQDALRERRPAGP